MHHKPHHKSSHRRPGRTRRKYKRLAVALAGAALLSSSLLPGTTPTVHAAAVSSPVAAEQQLSPDKEAAANTPASYETAVNVTATAYAPGAADNDQWGSKTHMGTQIRPGVIAVDPKVIPLGSRVYIQYPDGHGEYAIAEDTGGAIKGNRIDVAKWTRSQAKNFGIKHVKVFVLNSSQKA